MLSIHSLTWELLGAQALPQLLCTREGFTTSKSFLCSPVLETHLHICQPELTRLVEQMLAAD